MKGIGTWAGPVVAVIAVAAVGCDKKAVDGQAGKPQAAATTAPAAAPAGPATAGAVRPSTRPGTVEPGDLITVEVSDLTGPGTNTTKPLRVEADGTIRLLVVPTPLRVGGMTITEAQAAIEQAYKDAQLIQRANVLVRRLSLGEPGPASAGPVARNDLLRVAIWELNGPGTENVRVVRVSETAGIGLPYIGAVPVVGSTPSECEAAIAKRLRDAKIIQNPMVSVVKLEAGLADAGELPDVATKPVPPAVRWLYEPADGPPADGRRAAR